MWKDREGVYESACQWLHGTRRAALLTLAPILILSTCIFSDSARQFPTLKHRWWWTGKINTVLHLRNGGELIIPLGSLPAGVRVEANYGEPPKVSWSRFRPIGEQVHFSVLPKTTFAEPLLLEYRVPPGVYRDAAKYGYFESQRLIPRITGGTRLQLVTIQLPIWSSLRFLISAGGVPRKTQ